MKKPDAYLMENRHETLRLELKTEPASVRAQALWGGIRPGMRVLDVGCGPGKTTSVLHELIQPEGTIIGIDWSEERISHAQKHYGKPGMAFSVRDLRDPLDDMGKFDFIWARFVLEYYRRESRDIVGNLKKALKPGGLICLLDLDHNGLNHYELPPALEELVSRLMVKLREEHNFDVHAGRKLYAHLYDHGFEDIQVHIAAHHLVYGRLGDVDAFNWMRKVEMIADRFGDLLQEYPGGCEAFLLDFRKFFYDPRRFTYTPLILCKGGIR